MHVEVFVTRHLKKLWSGRKPSIIHLKVFRCIIYAHVLDQFRKKLDDKGEKCIFIKCNTNSKAYKLYNSEAMKVIINQDVTFDEKDIHLISHKGNDNDPFYDDIHAIKKNEALELINFPTNKRPI
ncbi:hypothetical protein CR513_12438, partial [Mucuna pruriens]